MKDKTLLLAASGLTLLAACGGQEQMPTFDAPQTTLTTIGNPYIPLWDHIPDGEPYVFEDPDNPGKFRVYLYGSHDIEVKNYCGRDQVVWSADVNDLNNWRLDGVILKVDKNGKGDPQKEADILFAPDVALSVDKDGKKTYYLYPNNQVGGRNGMVAKSDRPDGPFEVINWNPKNPDITDGVLAFDPAVFVDDDGKVYGYWGFERSYAAELDPATMATVKPGTKIVEDMVSGRNQEGVFKFFEASSLRKIKDKYVFIYSRFTMDGEFGLPTSNYTLAYAYGDNPLGPWTYGGTIIDGRGREKDPDGKVFASGTVDGNTHGSICEINGKWWVFYHRQNGLNEFSRQAMVAPITVTVEEGKGGKASGRAGREARAGQVRSRARRNFIPQGAELRKRQSSLRPILEGTDGPRQARSCNFRVPRVVASRWRDCPEELFQEARPQHDRGHREAFFDVQPRRIHKLSLQAPAPPSRREVRRRRKDAGAASGDGEVRDGGEGSS